MLKGFINKFAKGFIAITTAAVFASGVSAANFAILPPTGTFSSNFTVGVYVRSANESVNAFSGTISFPQDKIQVVAISRNSSIVSLWTQEPTFSNTSGTISFEGVAFNPGFQGAAGKIIDVTFSVRATGTAPVIFTRSQILANDGNGTDVTRPAENAVYNLVVAAPVPPTPPGPVPPAPSPSTPTAKPTTPTIGDYSNPVTQPGTLMVSGKTDPNTKIVIYVQKDGEFKSGGSCDVLALGTTIKEGDEGESVSALQLFLSNNLSLPKDSVSGGYFGLKTKAAVSSFQSKYSGTIVSAKSEDVSGVVGDSTIEKINKISCGFLKELPPIDIKLADGAYVLNAASEGLTPGKYHFWLKAATDKGVLSDASEAVPLTIYGKPALSPDGRNWWGIIFDILFIIALIAILVYPLTVSPLVLPLKTGIYGGLLFIFGLAFYAVLLRFSFWPKLLFSIIVLSSIAYLWKILRDQIAMSGSRIIIPQRMPKDPHAPPPYEP